MIKKLLLLVILFTTAMSSALAQRASIRGAVMDPAENLKLVNSSILLIRSADSVLAKSVRADSEGKFQLSNLQKGRYQLVITYPKMADNIFTLNLSDSSNIDLKIINMEQKSKVIEEVVIRAKRDAMRIKGDTITYVADSFKVEAGANVQELLKRLPGFQIDADGTIKAQGEEVKTVLVDGDEFFGDDPLLATKYLKASSVKEIEVYDKKSKNAELTGIDDGTKNKTVNIKLKDSAKNGYIANLDANTNGNDFNDFGGMFGIFKNKMKAAVFGNQANIGLRSKANNAFNNLKGNDYDLIEVSDDGSIMIMGFGDSDYFNPSNGLPNDRTLGAHLSNKWNDNKIGMKLNYKFAERENTNLTTSNFQRLLPNQQIFVTSGNADNKNSNLTNDLSGNVEIKIDSLSNLKFSFGFKDGNGNITTNELSKTIDGNGLDISNNFQQNLGTSTNEGMNGNINYSKKFTKKGRSLIIDLQPDLKSSSSNQTSLNTTNYYTSGGILDRTDNLNLLKINSGKQNSIGSRVSFSEPISSNITVQATYSFKNTYSESFKNSYDNTQLIGGKPKQVDSLSNNFEFNSLSHIGKGVIQYKNPKFGVNIGLEATQTNFSLNDLDRKSEFNRSYLNLGPNSNLNIKLADNLNLRANYTGTTRQPSLDQLQPIRELNNPLYQIIGNPLLKPSFTNSFSTGINSYTPKTQQYLSIGINYNMVNNEIVNTETIDENNRRVISYINIDGNKNYGANIYYDRGFEKYKISLNGNLSYNKSERTALINNVFNESINESYNIGYGFYFYPKNITFSYNGYSAINTGRSTIGQLFAGNNITHNHNFRLTIKLPYNMEFTNILSVSLRPANAVFTEPLNLQKWDSSFAVKALKNNALELKLSVSDILNQQIGYNRSVSGNTLSESTYSFIPRYGLIGINYNFGGNFKSKEN